MECRGKISYHGYVQQTNWRVPRKVFIGGATRSRSIHSFDCGSSLVKRRVREVRYC